jgi:polyphosphate kinase 2
MGHKNKKQKKFLDNETGPENNTEKSTDFNSEEEIPKFNKHGKISNSFYNQELAKLQQELVIWQYWIKQNGLRVVIVFEGRDAAGKGGIIKRITEPLNPRGLRVVALEKPSDKERTQWYFQRYISHLPSAGEIVIFDRSWYNRAGVERVMGFCTNEEYEEFLRTCPEFEKMIVRAGIHLIKYWISVSDEEQERRLKDRAAHPEKRWKLSEMDLKSWDKWVEYSKAKDEMMKYTDTKICPWYNVNSEDKKRARLNTISHLLSLIHYQNVIPQPFDFPPRKIVESYIRPPIDETTWIPEVY